MKTSLLIFGGFCIAYNLSNMFHELGHGFAACLSGGGIASIGLNPFCWNWIYLAPNPHPLFASWGGVLFGVLFAGVLSGAAFLIRSPFLTPLYLLGGCALAVNGIYLSVAAFADVGDAASLVDEGMPRGWIIGLGLGLLVASCLWTSLVQSLFGIPSRAPLPRRLLTLHTGVTPYLLVMCIYVLVFASTEASLFLAFAGVGTVAVTAIAFLGHLLRHIATGPLGLASVEPTWGSAVTVLICGILVVVTELVLFGL